MARTGPLVAVLTTLALTPLQAAPAAAAADVAPVDLGGAHWIWYPEGSPAQDAPVATRYLRRTFTVPAGPYTEAQLVVTGDDTVDVWVNGTYLAGSPRVADSWRKASFVDVAAALRPGGNTLAVAVRNTGGPAGVLGRLHVVASGGTVDLVTDGSWRAANSVPENWSDPAYGDTAWPAARDLGAYGVAPWN
ncbi:MAG TPA: rhamnosidase, partial [Actinoplanes sp.]|nr:rhamnosidase [Actinoplanes sp.]